MIYLDNAATSNFKPQEVISAVQREILSPANPGRSGHNRALRSALCVMKTRDSVTKYFNTNYNLVFTKNCTEALNLAILGSLKEGDHVITTAYEHNSVLRPLHYLKEKGVITLTIVPPEINGEISPIRVRSFINRNTKLIVTTHVSNVTGYSVDINELGKIAARQGAFFLVDAAQSAGHIPIDIPATNIDMLAAPAHKGLYGIQGLGFLIFSDRVPLNPIIFGGTGTNSDNVYQPHMPPEAFESGTVNTPAIAGLGEAIIWHNKNGISVATNIAKLTHELLYGLSSLNGVTVYTPKNSINGVVCFNIKGYDSAIIGDILNREDDIAVRTGLHCAPLTHRFLGTLETGAVRASLGADNKTKDISGLLRGIERIVSKKTT